MIAKFKNLIIFLNNFFFLLPKEVSTNPNNDFLDAILKSQDKATKFFQLNLFLKKKKLHSRPPPKAGPSIQAIVGIGRFCLNF